jgi:acetolactate synthase I/II/III large subunit
MQVHGGILAAEALRRHGVDVVFTLSGGHLFPLYDGCVQRGVRLVDVRHEQTAIFAAEAFAKVSRRVGVAAVTAGPGVTNSVSAVTTAQLTGSPLLLLGGRAPESRWGEGSLQELDHVPILDPVTKRAATSRATAAIGDDVDASLRAACTPHRGPAFLDVPMDLFFGSVEAPDEPPAVDPATLRGGDPDPEDLGRIAALLAGARRPVLVAGADVHWDRAEAALVRLAEGLRIPVVVSGLGRGTIPADHPLAVSRSRGMALRDADLVLVVGAPLDFRLGFGRFDGGRVVHVADVPERTAHHVDLAASASGDLTAVLDGILDWSSGAAVLDHDEWVDRLAVEEAALRSHERELLLSDGAPVNPARIYGELATRLERDAVVIGDGGDFVSYAGKYVDTHVPGSFLDPGPYGCLGTGPGYVLGAHLARPDAQIVALLGDGALGFSLGDLDTLVRHSVPATIIVGNNSCWGLEKHPMQAIYGYHAVAELGHETRYDLVMEALGGHGELVREPSEVGPAIDRAMATGGPALVNVVTDADNVYPRVSSLA